mmetsp:Transcript_18008/g.44998  ORF Transcript_18008/g.44998 Transcript_18008/m.44998 type:complete len:1643 (-) Transcript_18008:667-5595(-)|eukprot:CAMPEP_0178985162 /NCGR_PEP_ID=MMETSP0795-20121207/2001_1 /TAXON_ID=88552 /ORGANISM="Amoebophrya sp., Strain Ameob2" /LENGTH=1642 /DNA_ID=CAMNT_0020676093 /DNA_START=81 /DNA_END=5009 /DNA_ORIENTATION=+
MAMRDTMVGGGETSAASSSSTSADRDPGFADVLSSYRSRAYSSGSSLQHRSLELPPRSRGAGGNNKRRRETPAGAPPPPKLKRSRSLEFPPTGGRRRGRGGARGGCSRGGTRGPRKIGGNSHSDDSSEDGEGDEEETPEEASRRVAEEQELQSAVERILDARSYEDPNKISASFRRFEGVTSPSAKYGNGSHNMFGSSASQLPGSNTNTRPASKQSSAGGGGRMKRGRGVAARYSAMTKQARQDVDEQATASLLKNAPTLATFLGATGSVSLDASPRNIASGTGIKMQMDVTTGGRGASMSSSLAVSPIRSQNRHQREQSGQEGGEDQRPTSPAIEMLQRTFAKHLRDLRPMLRQASRSRSQSPQKREKGTGFILGSKNSIEEEIEKRISEENRKREAEADRKRQKNLMTCPRGLVPAESGTGAEGSGGKDAGSGASADDYSASIGGGSGSGNISGGGSLSSSPTKTGGWQHHESAGDIKYRRNHATWKDWVDSMHRGSSTHGPGLGNHNNRSVPAFPRPDYDPEFVQNTFVGGSSFLEFGTSMGEHPSQIEDRIRARKARIAAKKAAPPPPESSQVDQKLLHQLSRHLKKQAASSTSILDTGSKPGTAGSSPAKGGGGGGQPSASKPGTRNKKKRGSSTTKSIDFSEMAGAQGKSGASTSSSSGTLLSEAATSSTAAPSSAIQTDTEHDALTGDFGGNMFSDQGGASKKPKRHSTSLELPPRRKTKSRNGKKPATDAAGDALRSSHSTILSGAGGGGNANRPATTTDVGTDNITKRRGTFLFVEQMTRAQTAQPMTAEVFRKRLRRFEQMAKTKVRHEFAAPAHFSTSKLLKAAASTFASGNNAGGVSRKNKRKHSSVDQQNTASAQSNSAPTSSSASSMEFPTSSEQPQTAVSGDGHTTMQPGEAGAHQQQKQFKMSGNRIKKPTSWKADLSFAVSPERTTRSPRKDEVPRVAAFEQHFPVSAAPAAAPPSSPPIKPTFSLTRLGAPLAGASASSNGHDHEHEPSNNDPAVAATRQQHLFTNFASSGQQHPNQLRTRPVSMQTTRRVRIVAPSDENLEALNKRPQSEQSATRRSPEKGALKRTYAPTRGSSSSHQQPAEVVVDSVADWAFAAGSAGAFSEGEHQQEMSASLSEGRFFRSGVLSSASVSPLDGDVGFASPSSPAEVVPVKLKGMTSAAAPEAIFPESASTLSTASRPMTTPAPTSEQMKRQRARNVYSPIVEDSDGERDSPVKLQSRSSDGGRAGPPPPAKKIMEPPHEINFDRELRKPSVLREDAENSDNAVVPTNYPHRYAEEMAARNRPHTSPTKPRAATADHYSRTAATGGGGGAPKSKPGGSSGSSSSLFSSSAAFDFPFANAESYKAETGGRSESDHAFSSRPVLSSSTTSTRRPQTTDPSLAAADDFANRHVEWLRQRKLFKATEERHQAEERARRTAAMKHEKAAAAPATSCSSAPLSTSEGKREGPPATWSLFGDRASRVINAEGRKRPHTVGNHSPLKNASFFTNPGPAKQPQGTRSGGNNENSFSKSTSSSTPASSNFPSHFPPPPPFSQTSKTKASQISRLHPPAPPFTAPPDRESVIKSELRREIQHIRRNAKANSETNGDQLRKVGRQMLAKWHPDKNPEQQQLATRIFQFVQQELN